MEAARVLTFWCSLVTELMVVVDKERTEEDLPAGGCWRAALRVAVAV